MQTKKPKQRTVSNVQSLPECGRAVIRKKVYAAFKSGQTKYAAAMKCHVHERTVGRWYAKFAEHGIEAIHGSKRGPKPGGEKHKLSDLQLAELKRIITDRTPDQLKFKFALWSSKAVKELVSRKYGAQICRRTARRYMQKLGFTYKTPIRLAREQNPAKVEAWLKEEYPAIRKKAAAEKGTIFWADESSVLTCETKVRGYSPKGTAPVLRTSANRSIRCNMISSVSNRGDMRFMIFEGAMNVDVFKDFLTRLNREIKGKIFLIVDNLKVHHARYLTEWLESRSRMLELFYLPSYSPELNPDEYLNRDLKARLAEQNLPTSKDALRQSVEMHMRKRQSAPDSIKKFFEKDEVRYASENY